MSRKLVLLAALAALATFVGGPPAAAHDVPHPDGTTLHRDCDWSVEKSAHDTNLTLAEGQTSSPVTYTVTVRATCTDSHHDAHGDHVTHDPVVDGHGRHPGHAAHHGMDLCVRVSDPKAPGPLFGDGVVCEGELVDGSLSTSYHRTLGPFHGCGEFSDTNTVTVTDLAHAAHPHGHVLDAASATVHINVPCVHGCTLTQGYWKTHSEFGPAPYDNSWASLPGGQGASTTFFLSGQTWYQVFWAPPSGGNVYYQLAHQYMAAVLNKLNGASSTASVDAALSSAVTFFNTYTPAQAGALGKNSTARQNALSLASTLASYNEGAIGPGHCDE
jgi:hypothetical protein